MWEQPSHPVTIASTTKPSESPHEKAPGRFFRIFTSLLLCLDEDSFHTLAVVTSSIERILPDVVAVTLKAVNAIQIDNLRPVDAHEVLKTLRVAHFSSVFTKKPSLT